MRTAMLDGAAAAAGETLSQSPPLDTVAVAVKVVGSSVVGITWRFCVRGESALVLNIWLTAAGSGRTRGNGGVLAAVNSTALPNRVR